MLLKKICEYGDRIVLSGEVIERSRFVRGMIGRSRFVVGGDWAIAFCWGDEGAIAFWGMKGQSRCFLVSDWAIAFYCWGGLGDRIVLFFSKISDIICLQIYL